MTEMPDDVMKAAREADREFWAQDVPSGNENTVSFYVARAILAERERCAKVAYAYADAHTSDHKMIGHIIGRKILFDAVDDGS